MTPTPFIPAKPRPLTDIEFCAWIGQALPGDQLEYHRGFLGIDTTAVISTLPEPERRRLRALASAANRAFEAALVHLVQVNPLFVEALMGRPTGWTGFASVATAWSPWLRRMRCEVWQQNCWPMDEVAE